MNSVKILILSVKRLIILVKRLIRQSYTSFYRLFHYHTMVYYYIWFSKNISWSYRRLAISQNRGGGNGVRTKYPQNDFVSEEFQGTFDFSCGEVEPRLPVVTRSTRWQQWRRRQVHLQNERPRPGPPTQPNRSPWPGPRIPVFASPCRLTPCHGVEPGRADAAVLRVAAGEIPPFWLKTAHGSASHGTTDPAVT
jgi:hypothetical protein